MFEWFEQFERFERFEQRPTINSILNFLSRFPKKYRERLIIHQSKIEIGKKLHFLV